MASAFMVGDWTVLPEMNSLERNGRTVRLEPKVMQVLNFLAQHHGEMVSKERLIRAVWADTFVTDEVLTRCISELRRTLNDDPKKPKFIETIPKSGYRLIPAPENPRKKSLKAVLMRWRWPIYGFAGVLALMTLFVSLDFYGARRQFVKLLRANRSTSEPNMVHSIAVLPLENLSGDPSQEYFADGMTDELITTLAKIGSLRVISRTSVMQYKGTRKPLPEIAGALNVDLIIAGAVARSGNQVRITAQLIDGRSDAHRWAQDFDRDLRNVLELQSDIAQTIAREIRIELTKEDGARLASRPPINPAAKDAYLRGRYQWSKRHDSHDNSTQALKESIRLYQQAVTYDPEYALAYAGIADSYIVLENDGDITPAEAYPAIKAAAVNAVDADPNLADAHMMLADVKENEWDWASAEREYKRAIELNPGLSRAHLWYAILLSTVGRPRDAILEVERAVQLDPLVDSLYFEEAEICYLARQYEKIPGILRTVEYRTPYSTGIHQYSGLVDLAEKRYPEAISEFRIVASAGHDEPDEWALLAYAYAQDGRRREAMEALAHLDQLERKRLVPPCWKALAWTGLGDFDRATYFLNEAYQERSSRLPLIQSDPLFDPLRSDARFRDLLHRLALPASPN